MILNVVRRPRVSHGRETMTEQEDSARRDAGRSSVDFSPRRLMTTCPSVPPRAKVHGTDAMHQLDMLVRIKTTGT